MCRLRTQSQAADPETALQLPVSSPFVQKKLTIIRELPSRIQIRVISSLLYLWYRANSPKKSYGFPDCKKADLKVGEKYQDLNFGLLKGISNPVAKL